MPVREGPACAGPVRKTRLRLATLTFRYNYENADEIAAGLDAFETSTV
jgi:hypothetical protein